MSASNAEAQVAAEIEAFSVLKAARQTQYKIDLLSKISLDLRSVLPEPDREWLGDNKPFACTANRGPTFDLLETTPETTPETTR